MVAVVVLAGCGADGAAGPAGGATADPPVADGPEGGGSEPDGSQAGPTPVDQITSSPVEDVTSALTAPDAADLPPPTIDLTELQAGGPPPDGIPAIDTPRFLAAGDVDFLADEEAVLALSLDGEDRAYPVQVMIWHEIVNDTVAGVPVAVTYCPLCNSAVAYDRRLDDGAGGERVVDFGTSGLLFRSSLVMYDRQTESLWSHFTGEAVAGFLTGAELDTIPVATVSWGDWRDAHPDGLVLSRDTGFDRDYGRNPYPGYDDIDEPPFLFDGEVDGRLAAKTRVVAVRGDQESVAVDQAELAERRVVEVALDGRDLVVWLVPGTASALESATVADGRDVGATGVFVPEAGGRSLTFTAEGDGFVDTETSTTWDVLGRGVDGPLADEQLEAVAHLDTFWFAWAAFEPATRIVP